MITGARRIKDLIRNRAKGDSAKAQMLLRHFAMERLLERLSVSPYKNDFILKGGMLLSSIVGIEERMTRDIDATMRSHDMSPENVARIINEISSIDIGDGFTFEPGEAAQIMEDSEYGGVRIPMTASIERTKTTFKIDVSTGDAITPDAIEYAYQLMFEDRSISLHSYNDETFLAEKLETILSLATQNTRMRDFYDIWALRASGREIDYDLLNCALEATRTVRKSIATIDDFKQIFALLQESTEMADAWRRYQLSNPFAESVNWQDALTALYDIMTDISSCSGANLSAATPWRVWRLGEHPEMTEEAAAWFSAKWGIPEEAYRESIRESVRADGAVPQWYVVRADNERRGAIIAGCGIIENDFHDRPDLSPNLCALYVEENYRHRRLARYLLDYARAATAAMGRKRLYLVTDLVGFYENCGWEYLGDAHEPDGNAIRLYGADACPTASKKNPPLKRGLSRKDPTMDADKKKELRAAYKERPRETGIVFVTCSGTGEMFLADVVDAPAAFNRMRFQLSSGLYPDKRLQALWDQHGENAFEFGVLQRLNPSDADTDIAEELETLLDLCLAEHPEATRLKAAHGARHR